MTGDELMVDYVKSGIKQGRNAASFKYGDSDDDGTITAADAAALLQKVLDNSYSPVMQKNNSDYRKMLDVNCDGQLTSADAAVVLQKTLDNKYKMPVEQ
jgi:hypothetical protein